MISSYRKGHWAEVFAAIALTLKGYLIIRRRYKTPIGEVDLIAQRGRYLVAIEVKARRTPQEGLEAISLEQQRRICQAMNRFRRRRQWGKLFVRYDAIIVCPYAWPRHFMDVWRDFS